MKIVSVAKPVIILTHALVGWAFCGLTMGLGMELTSLPRALMIHMRAVPFIFILVSGVYFSRFNYTQPLPTAAIFVLVAFLMDFFVVALLIQGNLAMFGSVPGVWIPLLLIFLSTWLTGVLGVSQRFNLLHLLNLPK